jgi:hypothetical protein
MQKGALPNIAKFKQQGVWGIPSSIYFCDPQFSFTLPWRAKIGLERAIRASKIVHVWLYPWNLLLYRSLREDLEKFLAPVALKRDRGKIDVMTMGELA